MGRACSDCFQAHPGYTNSTQGNTRNIISPHVEACLEPDLKVGSKNSSDTSLEFSMPDLGVGGAASDLPPVVRSAK